MSFVNTVLDSIGNSLVITAVGGGTEVIPWLTGQSWRTLHCSTSTRQSWPAGLTRWCLTRSVRRVACVVRFLGAPGETLALELRWLFAAVLHCSKLTHVHRS